MSPLFLVGCGLIVAAVLLGATGAPAGIWVVAGAAGVALFWRGATTTPRRRIRSHRGSASRSAGSRVAGGRGARQSGSRRVSGSQAAQEPARPVPPARGGKQRGRSRPRRRSR
jgi:hypothetical protein